MPICKLCKKNINNDELNNIQDELIILKIDTYSTHPTAVIQTYRTMRGMICRKCANARLIRCFWCGTLCQRHKKVYNTTLGMCIVCHNSN